MSVIQHRWENGIYHHPEAYRLLRAAAALDKNLEVDLRFGGDGDNGEALTFLLSELMEREERARTYRHFKGREYVFLHEATCADTQRPMVVYRNPEGMVFTRMKGEWEQEVEWPDGVVRPRFVPVGSDTLSNP